MKGVEIAVGVRVVLDLPADTPPEEAYRLARELVEDHATPAMHQADPRVSAVKFANVSGFRIRER